MIESWKRQSAVGQGEDSTRRPDRMPAGESSDTCSRSRPRQPGRGGTPYATPSSGAHSSLRRGWSAYYCRRRVRSGALSQRKAQGGESDLLSQAGTHPFALEPLGLPRHRSSGAYSADT